jgi:hypothetical protein
MELEYQDPAWARLPGRGAHRARGRGGYDNRPVAPAGVPAADVVGSGDVPGPSRVSSVQASGPWIPTWVQVWSASWAWAGYEPPARGRPLSGRSPLPTWQGAQHGPSESRNPNECGALRVRAQAP